MVACGSGHMHTNCLSTLYHKSIGAVRCSLAILMMGDIANKIWYARTHSLTPLLESLILYCRLPILISILIFVIYRTNSPSSSTSLTIFLVALTRGCWPLFRTLCILLKYLVAKSMLMPLFLLYFLLSHNCNVDTHAEITVLIPTLLYALFVLCVHMNWLWRYQWSYPES